MGNHISKPLKAETDEVGFIASFAGINPGINYRIINYKRYDSDYSKYFVFSIVPIVYNYLEDAKYPCALYSRDFRISLSKSKYYNSYDGYMLKEELEILLDILKSPYNGFDTFWKYMINELNTNYECHFPNNYEMPDYSKLKVFEY